MINSYHRPRNAEELTARNVETVARLERSAEKGRATPDVVVDAVSRFCGSMTFVYVHAIWFGGWIALNALPSTHPAMRFDPSPFSLLTLVVSLEAIFLSTFILISQNRQNKIAERRNHLDLQINLLSEQETTKVLSMLDAIQNHLGIRDAADPEIDVLEQSTRPDRLVAQIEQVIEKKEREEKTRQRRGRA